ncbi:hypothetical protein QBC38DRAFT_177563 [Podospora fimiseda]|uniref:DUF8004 domain-containing protein n=1 Tax=Podospora fimiseda TaxID=252190 RepID=A0AAN7BYP3_9PEZI|nr:hypothetical protein QBC38DRAFT_177563 [Podospora fimiseda]
MSGRSAHVRKKITETKGNERSGAGRGRSKSSASSDNATISDYPIGLMPIRQERDITGVPTTNARFLKFSEHAREDELYAYRVHGSGGSQSGSSVDGRRDLASSNHNRPLDDFAYARARRPVIKTEDVSGIEKSGLRSRLDKKSDEVRKGLVKALTFGKNKDKKGTADRALEFRPQSAATVRPNGSSDPNDGYEADLSPIQYQSPHPGVPWDDTGMLSPPPSAKLPSVPGAATAPHIKRWIGAGRAPQRWNKLRKDPELWDPNGDVLVFFGQKGQSPRPAPSFRLSSHVIEATESRFLITLLREGSTEEDINLPPSPVGAPPILQRGFYGQQRLAPGGYGRGGQPTPPVSEDSNLWEMDGQISYEMYFPTPQHLNRLDQLRHHITTRNVFAMLYHASMVGLSLYQGLSDLQARLEAYMPPEADNVGTILNYISARGIDDVRDDPETAVSLLAWSEGSDVRWEEGWRECFLHCAGMYPRLEACADFKHVTPITRALLERAHLETQLRVQAAEERLATFQYSDLWPTSVAIAANSTGPITSSPAKAAADRLQKFFVSYYTREFGSWPPPPPPQDQNIGVAHGGGSDEEEEMWLTRSVAQLLQKDFGALYDYLVNRDILWDVSEARSSRKWMMVSASGNQAFDADTEDLPMTDILIEFDNKNRFPHIPRPYPLVPESIPPSISPSTNSQPSSGMFKPKKSSGQSNNTTTTKSGGALDRRIQLAYTESTNLCMLGSDFTHSALIDAFAKFEKTDCINQIDPSLARRGRWVLIYGILQTLASVSVDAPNVRYRDNVAYHLSPRLKGAKLPPWRTGGHYRQLQQSNAYDEAAHELSHCWLAPRIWMNNGSSASNSGADSSAGEEYGYGVVGGRYNFPAVPRGTPPASLFRSNHSVRSGSSRAASVAGTGGGYSAAASVSGGGYAESDAGSRRLGSSSNRRRGGGHFETVDENGGWGRGQTYAYSGSQGGGEEKVMDDGRSFMTAYSRPDRQGQRDRSVVRGGQQHGGSRRGTVVDYEEDSGPPAIRDFDELDNVIDDNAP